MKNPNKQHFKINNKDLIQKICDFYIKSQSIKKCCEKFKFGKFAIKNVLLRNNIPITVKRRIFKINEDYFEKINTETKAYFLGWMVSDGNVYKNNVVLACKDVEILEMFKKDLNYEGKIYKDKKRYVSYYYFFKKISSRFS